MPSNDPKVLNRVVDEIQDFGHFATVFSGENIEYLMRGGVVWLEIGNFSCGNMIQVHCTL